jgi:hypothetical protein
MRSLLRYIFLLIVFSAGKLGAADTLTPDYRRIADSLANAGDRYTSSLYYRKAAFFETNNNLKCILNLKAAEQLKLLSRYNEAITVLAASNVQDVTDTLIYATKYEAALLSYLNGDFFTAENYLLQAKYLMKDSLLFYDSYVLNVLILNEEYRWNEAAEKLRDLNAVRNQGKDSLQSANKAMISSVYDSRCLPRILNKEKAVTMSTFFPGLGQTYAGYPGEGAISMGAILLTSAGAVLGIVNHYYFTSIVLGNMLIGKFYQGGIARTEHLVDKRNYLRAKAFNARAKSEILTAFKK